MSRSDPEVQLTNPATRFFDFAGGTGEVQYYDKEQKANQTVPLPFKFLVLDEVMTVGGGYDNHGDFTGYYSTAIRSKNAKKDTIKVWAQEKGKKARLAYEGLWADIKANLTGAKYIKGIYISWYNPVSKEMEIGYLKIRGAALMPWVEFTDKKNVETGAFSIVGNKPEKKGSNNFFSPVFEWTETVKTEVEEQAIALDANILKPYLDAYFARAAEDRGHTDQPDSSDFAEPQARAATAGSDEPPYEPENIDPPEDFGW